MDEADRILLAEEFMRYLEANGLEVIVHRGCCFSLTDVDEINLMAGFAKNEPFQFRDVPDPYAELPNPNKSQGPPVKITPEVIETVLSMRGSKPAAVMREVRRKHKISISQGYIYKIRRQHGQGRTSNQAQASSS